MTDVRFATALQLMLSLALAAEDGPELVSSSELALKLGTNPSLVRKVMALLVRADLVASSMGPGGGVRLAKPAAKITFRDVFLAVVGTKPLLPQRAAAPCVCIVSRNFEEIFASTAADVEDAALVRLAERTLEGALTQLRTLDAQRPARSREMTARSRERPRSPRDRR